MMWLGSDEPGCVKMFALQLLHLGSPKAIGTGFGPPIGPPSSEH